MKIEQAKEAQAGVEAAMTALDEDKLVIARQALRDEAADLKIRIAKENKMNEKKEETMHMGGPVLVDTVYDSIIMMIRDTNQEIRTELEELDQKVTFISAERPASSSKAEYEATPQNFPDTDLSVSLKSLLGQSEEILYSLRNVTSAIVS